MNNLNDELLIELTNLAETCDLWKPIGEDRVKDLPLEALKHLRQKLFWRVQEIVLEDFREVNASAGLELLGNRHPYRRIFKTETPGGNTTIYYRGVKVFDAQNCHIVLGRWISELMDFAHQIRAQREIQKEIEMRNERDELIASFAQAI